MVRLIHDMIERRKTEWIARLDRLGRLLGKKP
jgi:hypothetical protein